MLWYNGKISKRNLIFFKPPSFEAKVVKSRKLKLEHTVSPSNKSRKKMRIVWFWRNFEEVRWKVGKRGNSKGMKSGPLSTLIVSRVLQRLQKLMHILHACYERLPVNMSSMLLYFKKSDVIFYYIFSQYPPC